MERKPSGPLRRGWTTGACATAATRAAYTALLTGEFPDPVAISLPRGQKPSFSLARESLGDGEAMAAIVKDAGDDPDVTHGALVVATVRHGAPGSGIAFKAGEGVGVVTKPGLPLAVGEPAINPSPRRLMAEVIGELARAHGAQADVEIEISIPGGAAMAKHTMNGRLGIEGGLSILGTTGIVVPYSCASWIASIHQGIDVARAANIGHAVASTGSTSEAAARDLYGLPDTALLDMGDFAGGLLKYLRKHPISRVTIAGGFAKIAKLAAGDLDLHSARSRVDIARLADWAEQAGADEDTLAKIRRAETGAQALAHARAAGVALADRVAEAARRTARGVAGDGIDIEVLIFDRNGELVGRGED